MGRIIKFISIVLLFCLVKLIGIGQTISVGTSGSFKLNAFSQSVVDSLPQPLGWINDFEDIFSDKQEKILDSLISNYETITTIEISIVTIDTFLVSKEKFDDIVLQIHNTWGVGKKAKNNGIVIGISAAYKQIRISNGYGIEAILSDSETKQIVDNDFIPYFKQGDYFAGTLHGLQVLMKKLDDNIKHSHDK